MEWLSNGIFGAVELLEHSTDYIGKHMKKLLLIIAILLVCIYWTEVSNFVSGNLSSTNSSVKQWLVDHTPKK
jgi:hypothetical protein